MDKFDKLSLLNDDKDENTVVSVIEPKIQKPVQTKKRPTIFSAFIANFKQDKELIYPSKGAELPNLSGTLTCLVSLVFLSAVMVALWYFIDKVTFIPVALVFLSTAIPCLIMCFYYEFDMGHTFPIGKLCLLIVIGALCYIVISQISAEMIDLVLNEAMINSIIMPIISNVVMFAVIFLVTSFFKSNSVRDYIMVVSFLVMGYVICQSFVKGFEELFISQKLDGSALYNIKVIVESEEMLEASMQNLLDGMFYNFILLPFLYSGWGAVYAYLIYYLAENKRKQRDIPKSMYLLLFLVIILNILAKVETAMVSFNVILRMLATIITVYILLKLLNFSLEEEPPRPLKEAFLKR